jgi:uncharacterized repeat protein (TIGR03899 family)
MTEPTVPEPWYLALIRGGAAIPKSVAKLIDTIGDHIGLWCEPSHIRQIAKAEAEAAITEAKARIEITTIELHGKLAVRNIADRAAERIRQKEARRQKNIESIVRQAAESLPDNVADVPVDPDWTAQFFSHCEDVSNEQMQSIWANILADEVATPGSFSRQTLAVVRVMSRTDADLFTRFCAVIWRTPHGLTPVILPNLEQTGSVPGIKLVFLDMIRLDALGVIKFEPLAGFNLTFVNPADVVMAWAYHHHWYVLKRQAVALIQIGPALLTEVGRELAIIAGSTPNEGYRDLVLNFLRGSGWEITEPIPAQQTPESTKQAIPGPVPSPVTGQ